MTELYQPTGGVWTYEEYMKLPVENTRYEIIAGQLYVTPTPPVLHQVILGEFLYTILRWADHHELGMLYPGPIDVLFGEGDFIEPDLVFVRRDRKAIVTERAIEGVPDLIAECVAPDTAERDRGLKRDRYMHFGVPEYWVIDGARRTVEIYRSDDPDPTVPRIATDRWEWQPVPGGPVLELYLPGLLQDYDETKARFEANAARKRAAAAGSIGSRWNMTGLQPAGGEPVRCSSESSLSVTSTHDTDVDGSE